MSVLLLYFSSTNSTQRCCRKHREIAVGAAQTLTLFGCLQHYLTCFAGQQAAATATALFLSCIDATQEATATSISLGQRREGGYLARLSQLELGASRDKWTEDQLDFEVCSSGTAQNPQAPFQHQRRRNQGKQQHALSALQGRWL